MTTAIKILTSKLIAREITYRPERYFNVIPIFTDKNTKSNSFDAQRHIDKTFRITCFVMEPVQFLLRQIPDGGPHISEHQNTRTMVKDSPPRAFTRRSYQMASKIPSTAPATAAVYCTATLVLQASMIRYPARNRITGIR